MILEKYLAVWIPVLGKWNRKIGYFDCFAGRGEYTDGSLGSPILALRQADRLAGYFDEMTFWFIEKDPDNFANLERVIEREKSFLRNLDQMSITVRNGEFDHEASELLAGLGRLGWSLIPSFFFIDPFGFSGASFAIVKRILACIKTEVFFTLMVRDINRFLELPELAELMTALYGGACWQGVINHPNREAALIELYRSQLHDQGCSKYSLHFKVCESDSTATLYHLIHATNNWKGHEAMKSVMYHQGVEGAFAYLGKNDLAERTQMRLFDANDPKQVRAVLLERFRGRTISFLDLLEAVCHPWYSEPPFMEKHYRAALKELAKEGVVKVERVTSKTARGLSGEDKVTFV